MSVNLPANVRAIIYVILAVGSPIVLYLQVTNVIGENEVNLWLALSAAVGALAKFNTPSH